MGSEYWRLAVGVEPWGARGREGEGSSWVLGTYEAWLLIQVSSLRAVVRLTLAAA